MNVLRNRDINKVVILGSGMSILNLTDDEKIYINRCKIVIAVNKFMAFYKESGILPTHIYFHDLYGFKLFIYILKVCKENNLENLTLFTSLFYNTVTFSNPFFILYHILKDLFLYRFKSLGVILLRLGKNSDIHKFKLLRPFKYYSLPRRCKVISISITKWNEGGKWANKLNHKIFHYRGSLTSVINIASIIAPNQEIMLVGNDFNSDRYFYEDSLNSLGIEWKDYTYESVKKTGTHYSFQNINGMKMEDKFPFILQKLSENGNCLSCNNVNSLLVTKVGIQFKPII